MYAVYWYSFSSICCILYILKFSHKSSLLIKDILHRHIWYKISIFIDNTISKIIRYKNLLLKSIILIFFYRKTNFDIFSTYINITQKIKFDFKSCVNFAQIWQNGLITHSFAIISGLIWEIFKGYFSYFRCIEDYLWINLAASKGK